MRLTFNHDSFPDPAHLPAAVRELAEERQKFADQGRRISTELLDLIGGAREAAARKADQADRAAAARAGKADPGQKHLAEHHKAVADVRARSSANSRAVEAITADLSAAIEKHAPDLHAAGVAAEDATAARYAAAAAQLRDAHEDYANALGLAGWATRVRNTLEDPGPSDSAVVFSPETPAAAPTMMMGKEPIPIDAALDALESSTETHTRRREHEAKLAREAAEEAERRKAREADRREAQAAHQG